MDLSEITPLILTFNEAPNLDRCLQRLTWAKRIIIVDSFSTDETLAIAKKYPNTQVVQRAFDHFADQCNFGLAQIETPWVLSLDADYIVPESLPSELSSVDGVIAGYQSSFRYCVFGTPLLGTLYPPRTILHRTEACKYERDGHAHRVKVEGIVQSLKSVVDHDDRKPLARWLKSQAGYAILEAEKLAQSNQKLGWRDKLRSYIVLAPVLTPIYCLIAKGLFLNGWAGIYYSLQRTYFELLLSLELLDRKLRR